MKSFLPPDLYSYVQANWVREPKILVRLREETAAMPEAGMQIPPDQGQLMQLLVQLMGVRRHLEIGVFTGYSSLAVALAVPDAEIVACDVSEEFTSVARRYWTEAGVADRIALHLRPGVESLDMFLSEGQAGTFDSAFIDADKPNYPHYLERVLALLRPGGLLMVDNVLWAGKVVDPEVTDPDTELFRKFNAALLADQRVDLALAPIGDGLTLARKR